MSNSSLNSDLEVNGLEYGHAYLKVYTKTLVFLMPLAYLVMYPLAENYVYLTGMLLLLVILNVVSTYLISKKEIHLFNHIRRFGNVAILFFIPVTSGGKIPFWVISIGIIYSLIFVEPSFWLRWLHVSLIFLSTVVALAVTGNDLIFVSTVGVVLIVTTVLCTSARYLLQQQIAQKDRATKQAEVANTTKDMLLSVIAHDFKSPFNGLIGMMEVLVDNSDEFSESERDKLYREILKDSRSTFSLLENLLLWSRAQRGVVEFVKEKIKVHKLVTMSCAPYFRTADTKEISIKTTIPSNLSMYVDEPSIRIVLSNLIHNAIKFTPKGGSITLSAEALNGSVILSVVDTGVGISENNVQKIFKPDLHKSTRGTDDERGTGLGLGLCYDLVKENGGRLQVESKEGVGSTFRVILPLK